MGLGERIAAMRQRSRTLIAVPEWGEDKPLDMYLSVFTCKDASLMERKHPGWVSKMTTEAMVDLLIMKAEDQKGDQLFTVEDKPHLMREPYALMMRVAAQIVGSVVTVEEQEKN